MPPRARSTTRARAGAAPPGARPASCCARAGAAPPGAGRAGARRTPRPTPSTPRGRAGAARAGRPAGPSSARRERRAGRIAWRAVSLLEAYRRSGADPPFGDPRRAHGVAFEGYYWRFTDAAAGSVVIVLCGVTIDATGPWAVVALAAHPEGIVRSSLVPVACADPAGL